MSEYIRKPEWLRIRLGDNDSFAQTKHLIGQHALNTICTSGKCPNQAECWSRGTATFMLLGDVCTRACGFCNTKTGRPLPPNSKEPSQLAETIKQMQLKHVVLTSVDRDDLPDLGVGHWVDSVQAIRRENPGITMEILIPDFQGKTELLDQVIAVKPEVLSHNLETVRRLTPSVRSAAKYDRSLAVLRYLSDGGLRTKSGLMLGLGETEEEIAEAMDDLLAAGCRVLTLGQYLQPTRKHLTVKRYVHPDAFKALKELGIQKGFEIVESGPLVRSSYRAERHL